MKHIRKSLFVLTCAMISGCAEAQNNGNWHYRTTTVREIYHSPTGGSSVYSVNGPGGSGVVTSHR